LVCAYDNNLAALHTYKENIGAHAFRADISKETDLPSTTVIIGGPPCQGFSSAGLRRTGDKRNSLVSCFAQAITSALETK
jgi:DNA (cytosine-5)-methyltransferase 1